MAYVGDQHPVAVGDQTTAMVLARLLEVYPLVLIPFGENQRYDLLIDEGDRFTRVQCKAGRLREGAILFATCSVTYHHPNNRGTKAYKHDYQGTADVFGVYCRETDRVYIVPVGAVGKVQASLRVNHCRNNQSLGIRWACDFELRAPG